MIGAVKNNPLKRVFLFVKMMMGRFGGVKFKGDNDVKENYSHIISGIYFPI